MTRPVYEPTPAREDARLGFGSNQLFRRPAPQSSHMWGVPDIILGEGATTIPNNTQFPVPFADLATPWTTDGSTPPITISDASGELFVADVTDDLDPGNDRWEVTSRREGWWAAHLITQWDEVATPGTYEIAAVSQKLTWTSTAGIGFDPVEFRNSADWMIDGSYDGGALVINSFGFQDDGYLSTVMMPHYLPSNKTWSATARQRTGTSRGMSGITLKIWFIQQDDLSGWTFESV